ncbi:hydroxypyruvate isomerase family protein [Algihabitans albus]|uniref:hydroxypyruvate isomerase family protein n=1 Tax=Algihabitans albus TaxID=2164067 RepID=UPI000E5C67D5|nr:TIM barrel protein [Algihabitans albus]
MFTTSQRATATTDLEPSRATRPDLRITRRTFLTTAAAATAAGSLSSKNSVSAVRADTVSRRFSLHFAPHLGLLSPDTGLFRHHAGPDPVDQIKFMADQGFTAMEDNWMKARDLDMQMRIGAELRRLDMRTGVIVNTMRYAEPTFVLDDANERERLMQEVRETAKVARRVGATYVTTLSGTAHPWLPRDYQTVNMIENLKWAGDVAAQEGLILAVEPINLKGWPGTFLTDVPHGNLIVKAVDMPSVKLLFDFWHQQIHGGDLIENLEQSWDQIGYFQLADNPGRVEPGLGEINYTPIIKRIADKGFDGVIGMEFDSSKPGRDGERSVIDAMLAIDPANGAG